MSATSNNVVRGPIRVTAFSTAARCGGRQPLTAPSGGGSGGNLNIYGGGGGCHEERSSGMGGASFFGGPGPSGHPQGGHFAHNHQGHSSPGSGGTAGYFSGHRGADGRPGLIIVTEFY